MPDPHRLRFAKLRIIVLTLTALAILSVLVFLLSGGTWLQPKVNLTTHIPDSTGLEPDADVLLNGVKVGKVRAVKLTHSREPNRIIEVQLEVEKRYLSAIPVDSVTTIDSANLLGDKYVDINMGKAEQQAREGDDLRYSVPTNLMQNIDLRQFDAQLRIIDQTIRDIQAGKGSLGQFVVSDALYQQFLDGVIKVEKQMHAATGSQSQLGQMLYSADAYNNARASIKQLDTRLAEFQSNPLLRDSAQYDQIRDQLAKIRQALADLEAGKGAGGQWIASDAAYTEWNRLVSSWIENVDALNSGRGEMGQLLLNAQVYESLTGSMRELGNSLKEFREDPRKFLRVRFKFF